MNEIFNETPQNIPNLIEVLDEQGNPTGQYEARPSEAASEEGTVFVTDEGTVASLADVTVH